MSLDEHEAHSSMSLRVPATGADTVFAYFFLNVGGLPDVGTPVPLLQEVDPEASVSERGTRNRR